MISSMNTIFLISLLLFIYTANASKELALTFDDAPVHSSLHFETNERTRLLIKKLKALNVPPVIIFANPCKQENKTALIQQLKRYRDAGHFIGNHTCSHPRLDDVGFEKYSDDTLKADTILTPLFSGQKFFRYPFLNESKDETLRNQMRDWLAQHDYRHGMVSLDNDDYLFSSKINEAKKQKKKIDYKKVEALFLEHVVGAAEFYNNLAVKTLGRSPKHVMLLHENDATVLFLESLVETLRKNGWTLISAIDAYRDPIYREKPKNTYANNGIIPQLAFEKTGERVWFPGFEELNQELDRILKLRARSTEL